MVCITLSCQEQNISGVPFAEVYPIDIDGLPEALPVDDGRDNNCDEMNDNENSKKELE